MKLDRDVSETGKGKYALINLRKLPGNPQTPKELAKLILEHPGCVEFGNKGEPDEFFVMKLRDICASHGLYAYANAARTIDPEYAEGIYELWSRSGCANPFHKVPD